MKFLHETPKTDEKEKEEVYLNVINYKDRKASETSFQ